MPITSPFVNRFSNFFLPSDLVVNLPQTRVWIVHHALSLSLYYLVKILWMSENQQQSEKCITINYKSQGSMTKHLKCDVLLYYKFIIQFGGERMIWQSYEQDYDVFLTHSVEMCTHTEPYPETSYPYPTINPQHCTHIHTLNTQHSQECHLHTVCITENYHTPCPHLFHFFQMCARTHVRTKIK